MNHQVGLTVISRRQFGLLTGGALVSLSLAGCQRLLADMPNDGRLGARPKQLKRSSSSGQVRLELDGGREAILRLPKINNGKELPLLVFLHGAGQTLEDMLDYLGTTPDDAGIAVLVPKSRGGTWDAIRGVFGVDVTSINSALERVFETEAIDATRVAIGGFSDGASYALSLGLINGNLFSKVVAFSPGFVIAGTSQGKSKFFISHGTADPILPIERCSRHIVTTLKARDYDVTFREFDGGHEVPPEILLEALQWVASRAFKTKAKNDLTLDI